MDLGRCELLYLNQVETPVSPVVLGIISFMEQIDRSLGA